MAFEFAPFSEHALARMFTAKHALRDPMHVRDIERAWPASSAPFARTASLALFTADIDGAAPRARTRERDGGVGAAGMSRSLSTSDIDGAAPRALFRSSGRNPVAPVYALPTTRARWGPAEWRGVHVPALAARGAPLARGQVRETLYQVDRPRVLYKTAAPRTPPSPVEGACAHWRARTADARRVGPPRDPLYVADISADRRARGWRNPGAGGGGGEGAFAPERGAARDPLDPVYTYDMGPGGTGPISTAAHLQPFSRARLMRTDGRGARPPPAAIEGASADALSARRRATRTRRGILDVDDVEGTRTGSRGDGFVLYRRPDYDEHTGRRRVAYNAPGEPAPPTKTTNKVDDIEGTNPGSAMGGPRIYRPSQLDHASRTEAIIARNGVRPDALEPTPARSATVELTMRALAARRALSAHADAVAAADAAGAREARAHAEDPTAQPPTRAGVDTSAPGDSDAMAVTGVTGVTGVTAAVTGKPTVPTADVHVVAADENNGGRAVPLAVRSEVPAPDALDGAPFEAGADSEAQPAPVSRAPAAPSLKLGGEQAPNFQRGAEQPRPVYDVTLAASRASAAARQTEVDAVRALS
ncbi:hypothetical protein KFE25_011229 [Diacronema lutheri]|uniref:Uncharacterized protein n=1 Tax=Diacronema lutheri TaxID=2081491 RepID=A0A8J5XKL2_DIALT|nr:hypothetical protein KFE25_011229 [Diacronema lutheri]